MTLESVANLAATALSADLRKPALYPVRARHWRNATTILAVYWMSWVILSLSHSKIAIGACLKQLAGMSVRCILFGQVELTHSLPLHVDRYRTR
jgi:hypothetical protein